MATLTAQHTTPPSSEPSQEAILCEYLPKNTLKQYHALKFTLALMLSSIFAWWLYVNQNAYTAPMYIFLSVIAITTIWVTYTSINGEASRDKNRQISTTQNSLIITTDDLVTTINKNDIHHAVWQEDSFQNQGLHIISKQGKALGHIDGQVLSNQEDARRFLRWLRTDANINFDVQWNA